MPESEVVFDNTVEALFKRGLGRKMTEPCRSRLKTAGLDLGAKIEGSVARPKYYEWVQIAAEELFPQEPRDEAVRKLGEAFMMGFDETMVGRTVIAMVRLLGPKRMLARMTQNFRSSNNYMDTKLVEKSKTEHEMWLSQTSGCPSYFIGVLEKGLAFAGAINPRVKIVPTANGPGTTYRITWDAKTKS